MNKYIDDNIDFMFEKAISETDNLKLIKRIYEKMYLYFNTSCYESNFKKWKYLMNTCSEQFYTTLLKNYNEKIFKIYEPIHTNNIIWMGEYKEVLESYKSLIENNNFKELSNKIKCINIKLKNGIISHTICYDYIVLLLELSGEIEKYIQENDKINMELYSIINDISSYYTDYKKTIENNDTELLKNEYKDYRDFKFSPCIQLIYNTEKYSISTFCNLEYINEAKNQIEFHEYQKINPKDKTIKSIQNIITLNDDNENPLSEPENFNKRRQAKILKILNIFLDGDAEFVKQKNNTFSLCSEVVFVIDSIINEDDEILTNIINKFYRNINYRKKYDIWNDFFEQEDYLYDIFYNTINYLYFDTEVEYDIDIYDTIELLSHKVYFEFLEAFENLKIELLSHNITNNHKIIKDTIKQTQETLISTYNYFKNIPSDYIDKILYYKLYNSIFETDDFKKQLNSISSFIKELKKPYTQLLVHYTNELKKELEFLTLGLNDLKNYLINEFS